jgi:hypothetical protein
MRTIERIPDSITIGQAAWDVLRRIRPNIASVDELLTYPQEAIEVCKATRREIGKKLSDHEILKCLINARKRSKLK